MTDPVNWASDTNFPAGSDPWSATPTKVAPSAGQIAAGSAPGSKMPGQWFNYLMNRIYTAVIERVSGPSVATSTDNAIMRWDGTGARTSQNSSATVDDSGNVLVSGSAEHAYASARSTTVGYAMHDGTPLFDSSGVPGWYNAATSFAWSSRVNAATMIFDITKYLPRGAVLTAISVIVNPGAARTGTDRMSVQIWKHTGALSGSQIGSTTYDDTTTNQQTITLSSLAETITSSHHSTAIFVSAGNDGASNQDAVLDITITFDDPGPRNY